MDGILQPRCKTCGEVLTPPRRKDMPARKYCNIKCYNDRHKSGVHRDQLDLRKLLKEEPIYCIQCGNLFVQRKLDQVLCSCACAAKRANKRKRLIERARTQHRQCIRKRCEQCGHRLPRSRGDKRFCNKTCVGQFRRERQRVIKAQATKTETNLD